RPSTFACLTSTLNELVLLGALSATTRPVAGICSSEVDALLPPRGQDVPKLIALEWCRSGERLS
ncbi:MAG TPA: hypothetical protein VGG77_02830, partial [Roseiarcus sp.]